ncbi:MAG: nickel-type superoxide dismutase maturation protease [Caldilineaceae bacterium]|nr:nickel-type superoxide dismutase maturation protease [Caldilineaceae bacterium]HRJ41382.1 nickel-type superoxide dismutase maturation protease [Caldilineaceae bacterium]
MQERLPKSGWIEIFRWRFGRRHAFRVVGESMTPTLPPEAVIFFDPAAYDDSPPQVGDVVVARHPFQSGLQIVKRVAEVRENGRYTLHSDNPVGSDSRGFGALPRSHILGRVTSRLK